MNETPSRPEMMKGLAEWLRNKAEFGCYSDEMNAQIVGWASEVEATCNRTGGEPMVDAAWVEKAMRLSVAWAAAYRAWESFGQYKAECANASEVFRRGSEIARNALRAHLETALGASPQAVTLQAQELPPLPDPVFQVEPQLATPMGFSARQMRDYARAALAAQKRATDSPSLQALEGGNG